MNRGEPYVVLLHNAIEFYNADGRLQLRLMKNELRDFDGNIIDPFLEEKTEKQKEQRNEQGCTDGAVDP